MRVEWYHQEKLYVRKPSGYSAVFLRTVGAGTPASSQTLFLMGLSVSTLSSHWVSLSSSITGSRLSSDNELLVANCWNVKSYLEQSRSP